MCEGDGLGRSASMEKWPADEGSGLGNHVGPTEGIGSHLSKGDRRITNRVKGLCRLRATSPRPGRPTSRATRRDPSEPPTPPPPPTTRPTTPRATTSPRRPRRPPKEPPRRRPARGGARPRPRARSRTNRTRARRRSRRRRRTPRRAERRRIVFEHLQTKRVFFSSPARDRGEPAKSHTRSTCLFNIRNDALRLRRRRSLLEASVFRRRPGPSRRVRSLARTRRLS